MVDWIEKISPILFAVCIKLLRKTIIHYALCYGLVQKAVKEIPEICLFVLYCESSSFRELKHVVEHFDEGSKQFGNEAELVPILNDYHLWEENMERSDKPFKLWRKFLSTLRETRVEIIKDGVGRLADQSKNSTPIMKTETEEVGPARLRR